MVVDVASVRRAHEEYLGWASDAAARPIVAIGDAGAEVITHGGTHWKVGMDRDLVVREMVGGDDARAEQEGW